MDGLGKRSRARNSSYGKFRVLPCSEVFHNRKVSIESEFIISGDTKMINSTSHPMSTIELTPNGGAGAKASCIPSARGIKNDHDIELKYRKS